MWLTLIISVYNSVELGFHLLELLDHESPWCTGNDNNRIKDFTCVFQSNKTFIKEETRIF